MANYGSYESTVTFLSGVDDANKIAATSYYTYDGNVPPGYRTVAQAIKWGDPTPGTAGGTGVMPLSTESGIPSLSESVSWKSGVPSPSAQNERLK